MLLELEADERDLKRSAFHMKISFMDYDLGYIDLEEKTLQPLKNPFGPRV